MRRILIDNRVRNIAQIYQHDIIKNRKEHVIKVLNKMGNALRHDHKYRYARYVQAIIQNYEALLVYQPDHLLKQERNAIHDIQHILTTKELKAEVPINCYQSSKKFYERIVSAMQYDIIRKEHLPQRMYELGIKSCVYCNSQYTINVKKGNKHIGNYEIDHCFPKSKYPFLCTTFYNLVPSCSRCNLNKNEDTLLFYPYTEDPEKLNPFYFRLTKQSLVNYLNNNKHRLLEIKLFCKEAGLKLHHEKHFLIEEIYREHTDIAEEIIWKSKAYNYSYRNSLRLSYDKSFPKAADFDRFILGNYTSPKDIHKRPMSKMMQDIARQLNVI